MTLVSVGVVDGAENNPPTYNSQNHFEIAGHYTLTEHLMVPEIFVFSKKVWDTLPELDRQLIRKASALAVERRRELWAARETKALDALKASGINVISDVDKAPFIAATETVRAQFGGKFSDLISRAQAVQPLVDAATLARKSQPSQGHAPLRRAAPVGLQEADQRVR